MEDTYNPILRKEEMPRLRLSEPRPTPEPGVAHALFKEGQRLVILWPGDRLTAGEVRWGNYRILYEVDITEHSLSFNCTLPCRSDAFDFHAEVQVTCSVDDPTTIIERNITDARAVLEPVLIATMRSVSRSYDVEETADAEKATTQAVKTEAYNVGFRIDRFLVKLTLEEDARAHIRRLRQIERDRERERREAELQRQRDELEMDRVRIRMDFYGPLIKEGNWQLLALQLMNQPEDVASVSQMLTQQRQTQMEYQLKALKIVLEENARKDGSQIEEAGKRILQRLLESFGQELEFRVLDEAQERRKALPAREKESRAAKSESTEGDTARQDDE